MSTSRANNCNYVVASYRLVQLTGVDALMNEAREAKLASASLPRLPSVRPPCEPSLSDDARLDSPTAASKMAFISAALSAARSVVSRAGAPGGEGGRDEALAMVCM